METLYASRPVVNWQEIDAWARAAGFKKTLGADMHVTIAFSRDPVDITDADALEDPYTSPMSNDREIKRLGPDGGATVLAFKDPHLEARWQEFIDDGARWDWPDYQPHITISHDAAGIDVSKLDSYMGKIELGPEIFKPVKENWEESVTEKHIEKKFTTTEIAKVDKKLGLVFGYGIICKMNGEDYFDLQDQHIPEDVMLKAALAFAEVNFAKDMHGKGDFGHEKIGGYPFLFPMTTEIAKSLGITIIKSGLLVALKPSEPSILEKFENGTYTGFSIGGMAHEIEEIA